MAQRCVAEEKVSFDEAGLISVMVFVAVWGIGGRVSVGYEYTVSHIL
jgi:hypothetical protein